MLSIPRTSVTLFRNNALVRLLPQDTQILIISLILVVMVKIIIDLMLQTRFGLLLRATGDNEQVVTALARNKGNMKIAGLIIANGLVALCGGVLTQQQRLFEISMGTGAMVLALASVIIGVNSLKRFEWLRPTTKTIIGTLVYKACYSLAISLGLRPGDMKLVTALLFLGILSAWIFKPRRVTHDA